MTWQDGPQRAAPRPARQRGRKPAGTRFTRRKASGRACGPAFPRCLPSKAGRRPTCCGVVVASDALAVRHPRLAAAPPSAVQLSPYCQCHAILSLGPPACRCPGSPVHLWTVPVVPWPLFAVLPRVPRIKPVPWVPRWPDAQRCPQTTAPTGAPPKARLAPNVPARPRARGSLYIQVQGG